MNKSQRFQDKAVNAFKKTNLFYSNGPFLGIQDPTVFGFKLFFHFDNINSPLLYGANTNIQEAPLNTAAGFLKSIGDMQRLYYLEKFIYLLSGINSQTPWYFQSIDGLKDAWKHDFTKPFIGDDKKLSIECLESIDLRVTALLDLYRKAAFDWKYRREIIPSNLRKFKLSVYIYEARSISNPNSIYFNPPQEPVEYGYGGNIKGDAARKNAELVSRLIGIDETRNDPDTPNVNIVEGVKMSTTRNLFHFDFCEFSSTEDPGHLDSISNSEPSVVKQKIDIQYFDVEEDNMYNFWTSTDSISDGYIKTLDRIALDDPKFQEPGIPLETNQIPSINQSQSSTPRGNTPDMINEANEKNNRIRSSRLRDGIRGAFDDINKNIEQKASRLKENNFEDDLNNLSNQAISRGTNAANAFLNGLFLGNIYGLSPGTILNPGGISRFFDSGPSISNENSTSQVGNNIFG